MPFYTIYNLLLDSKDIKQFIGKSK